MRLNQVRELTFYDPGPSVRPCKSGPRVVEFAGCSSSVCTSRAEGSIFILITLKWMKNRECQLMSGVARSPTRRVEDVMDALELNAISPACESDKAGVEPPTVYRHRLIHRARHG